MVVAGEVELSGEIGPRLAPVARTANAVDRYRRGVLRWIVALGLGLGLVAAGTAGAAGGGSAAGAVATPPGEPAREPAVAARNDEQGEAGGEDEGDGEDQAEDAAAPDPAAALPVVREEVVVTATGLEQPVGDVAASVVVLGEERLDAAAALTLDDALRQVPGFTLFRRTGSRTSNPTTQGASLRGIGGSGAGRVLVLADGVPLADPFGGWVAWGRLPRVAVERVEVVRGGTSGLYGSSALAGVVHLVRRDLPEDEEERLVLDASGGDRDTGAASLWAAAGRGDWSASVAAEGLTTEGHVPVAPARRGAVDRPAGTRHGTVEATVERAPDAGSRWFLRGGLFDEERTNGTVLQENETRIEHASGGWDRLGRSSLVELRGWTAEHELHQRFSAVSEDRDEERLVRRQRVPSRVRGASARWTSTAGSRHTLLAGLEAERREGISREQVFLPGRVLDLASGGEQEEVGLLVEDVLRAGPRLSVVAGLRYDRWRNEPEAASGEQDRAREEDMLSPRLAVRWQPRPSLGWIASAYRSFRAPTLNELYRGFRVGDVVTGPNAGLTAERLTGAEAGAVWTPGRVRGGLSVAGSLFWMHLDDPIANVTLGTDDGVILRQRQNLGSSRSRGAELETQWRPSRAWRLGASALWTDAEITDAPADPRLEGRSVPQVPELQASVQLAWQGRHREAALQARWSGRQYDDDRNRFVLEEYFLLDLRTAWRLGSGLQAYVAVENLLDEEVTVGRTPVRTLGTPRSLRLGVRWNPGEAPFRGRREGPGR